MRGPTLVVRAQGGVSRHAMPLLGMSENNLVITRRVGETIIIGDDTTVTVLGIKGGTVKIGINSPEQVKPDNCQEEGDLTNS